MNSLQGLVAARIAELHITKQSVADAIGCSLVTFNKKVNGESDMTITEARKLANAIEKSADSRPSAEAKRETLRETRLDQMVTTLTKAYRDWEREQKGEKQA
jgi:plasmid maintenance system antidote protein VapI